MKRFSYAKRKWGSTNMFNGFKSSKKKTQNKKLNGILYELLLNFSQLYTPLSDTTVLPRMFVNNYLLPGIIATSLASVVFTMIYCCTVLCCCQDEYIYPLGYSQ